jgi:hypothetical protein
MKNLSLFLLISFTSCVSMKDYRMAVEKRDSLLEVNKGMRKEIRFLSKEANILQDTLQAIRERQADIAFQINRRMNRLQLHNGADPAILAGLTLRDPSVFHMDYNVYRQTHNMKDTHAARNTTWLSPAEKQVYYYLNYARLDPKGFCNRFILPMYKKDTGDIYLTTLVDYMYRMHPVCALLPNQRQFENARCHAQSSGVSGYVGHERQSSECRKEFRGESCAYGNSDPLRIVLQLLIDRGVSSLGHRYMCLGIYTEVGIANAPHSVYGTNTVLNFR